MKLTIKGSQGRVFEVEVSDSATVADLKAAIEQTNSDCPAGSLRLIYSGKILADANTLESYNVKDGNSVHMVVSRGQTRATQPTPPPQPAPQPTTQELPTPPPPQPQANPFASFGNLGGLGGLGGMNPAAIGEMLNNPMIRQMMDEMMANPELMINMIRANPMTANDPMVQSLLANPDAFAEQIRMARSMMGGGQSQAGQPSTPPPASGGFGFGSFADLLRNPMVQQTMQSVAENPDMLQSMLNNPLFANNPMFQSMAGNPDLVRQQMEVMRGMFGGAPAAQPAAAEATPHQRQLLRALLGAEPTAGQLQTVASNDSVRSALSQIARALGTLRRNGLMVMSNENIDDAIAGLSGTAAPAGAPAPAAAPAPTPSPTPTLTPEERFGPQLRAMNDMGLLDNQRNLEALIATNGNVNAAVNWIFSH